MLNKLDQFKQNFTAIKINYVEAIQLLKISKKYMDEDDVDSRIFIVIIVDVKNIRHTMIFWYIVLIINCVWENIHLITKMCLLRNDHQKNIHLITKLISAKWVTEKYYLWLIDGALIGDKAFISKANRLIAHN